jgi:hypothetical protein
VRGARLGQNLTSFGSDRPVGRVGADAGRHGDADADQAGDDEESEGDAATTGGAS